jgi:hypothetical protein
MVQDCDLAARSDIGNFQAFYLLKAFEQTGIKLLLNKKARCFPSFLPSLP